MRVFATPAATHAGGMKIAIYGAGAIGSTFAFQLARGGHDVTVIARGARLAYLETVRAIVRGDGERAPVEIAAALAPEIAYDLVLVPMLAPQVAAVLPALKASSARAIMIMANTFESIDPWRDAIGAARFVAGFPGGVFCLIKHDQIHPRIRRGTTVGDKRWAEVFSKAGIPTVVDDDMPSWLRTHVAMVVPVMAAAVIANTRGAGLSWSEARAHARAWRAGAAIVRSAGNALTPGGIRRMFTMPLGMLALSMWMFSRTKLLRDLGELGPAECRLLIDMMSTAAPELAEPIRAIRP